MFENYNYADGCRKFCNESDIEKFRILIDHEIRTPVNIIISASQLLNMYNHDIKSKLSESKIAYYNEIIRKNIYRLIKVTNNLTELTKINNNEMYMNYNKGDIIIHLYAIVQAASRFAKRRGACILLYTNEKHKDIIYDFEKFEDIVLNIISNSVKFSGDNSIIEIRVDTDENVNISIKDRGRGINKCAINEIFHVIKKCDKVINRDHEGLGLGLFISKAYTELHAGNISVSSNYDEGTEMKFSIPLMEDTGEYLVKPLSDKKTLEEKAFMYFSDII